MLFNEQVGRRGPFSVKIQTPTL